MAHRGDFGQRARAGCALDVHIAHNFNPRHGTGPLHQAAFEGRADAVRALVRAGARVNAAGAGGRTPLHEAASQGHVAAARRLLEAGAALGAADVDGDTPLHTAVMLGQEAVARQLLRAGASPLLPPPRP